MINKYIQPSGSTYNNIDNYKFAKYSTKSELENIEPRYEDKNSLISTKDFQKSQSDFLESSEKFKKINELNGDFIQ